MSLGREQHRALREASQWYARLADEQVDSDAERAWRHWVAADEGARFQKVVNGMAETVTELGPLWLRGAVDKANEVA